MNEDRVARELGDVRQELGDVQGTLRALDFTVTRFMETWGRQDTAANESRRALHLEVNGLSERVATAETTLGNVKTSLDTLKTEIETDINPTVTAYRLAMAHRAGMFFAGKLFWTGVLAVATVVGFFLHQAFQYLSSGHVILGH